MAKRLGHDMDQELDIGGGVLTAQGITGINQGIQLWRDAQAHAMQLHQKPIREFAEMSVDDQRQALIEWKLKYTPTSIIWPEQGHPELQWQFPVGQSTEERAQKVRQYEDYIDSLRGHSGFEMPEVQQLVRERRKALIEAVHRASERTLDEILSVPGFERYTRSKEHSSSLEKNLRTFILLGATRCYPAALLYDLFNDPPAFLQRTVPDSVQAPRTSQYEPLLSEREKIFIAWLEDAAKHARSGWLTLAMINHRNAQLSPALKVFKPRRYKAVDASNIRALLSGLRKYSGLDTAIESGGKMWRFKDWKNQ